MPNSQTTPGIVAGRLVPDAYARNFDDICGPFDIHEATVAADRCYFCHDAPCIAACPTAIDIPLFIRQIQTGTPEAAARTIFEQNIMGGMCARVCPTENLCEGACVREAAEGKPVEIGRLQRFATDTLMGANVHPFTRAVATGFRVAVVGAGPAGMSCAHRLAVRGHEVTVFEAREKAGGLNEYGIAAYKAPDDFAAKEIDWLMGIGGISVSAGVRLGVEVTLSELREDFDAVFLGCGLGGVNGLGIDGETLGHVTDAVEFIARLRQTPDKSRIPIGRNVVVIGGGMTAIDAAVQSKLLGAEHVTLVYRRGRARMGASHHEQMHAAEAGVTILTNATPRRILGDSTVAGVEFAYTEETASGLRVSEQTFTLPADQVFKAIGQRLADDTVLERRDGKIAVDVRGRSSLAGVWAGGDCATGGDDLTVTAVAQGRDAAEDIHLSLMKGVTAVAAE
jgi:dihydropyrimidine dehydrogenase (NAD+) subunit PreT